MKSISNIDSFPFQKKALLDEQKKVLITDLDYIVQECIKEFPTLQAVILYGGYGRGEGSWIYDNEKWKPYNDYDIVVIVKKRLNNIKYQNLELN